MPTDLLAPPMRLGLGAAAGREVVEVLETDELDDDRPMLPASAAWCARGMTANSAAAKNDATRREMEGFMLLP